MTSLEQYYVSAIIPVYNGEHFLARAINNILSQQHHPLEIIIIDDGSTDNTANIAENYPDIIYHYQENAGPSAARNQGIKLAKGNVIAFLDVDDLWSANKLAIQLQCLKENPDVEIVQGLIQKVKYLALETGKILSSHFYEPYQHILLGSSIYRSSVFEKVGLFDESMMYGEDFDWYIRAWENNIVKKVILETTLFYYLHKGGMTFGKNVREKGLFHIYKKRLERLRDNPTLTNNPVKSSIKIGEYIGEDIIIKNYRLSNQINNSMIEQPLISVIIPVYNCDRYLGEAIESVLAQSYRPLEILIIDDGSTDNSAEIAKSFIPHIQYYYQPHNGFISKALNHGISLSRGDFLAFLDSDDLWSDSNKLTNQLQVLQKDPTVDLVFSYVQQFISPELDEDYKRKIDILHEIMPAYVRGSLLLKRETLLQVGYFSSDWHIVDFIDWYIRAKELGLKDLVIPEIYLKRRIHTTNISLKKSIYRNDYTRILKKSLDRRRGKL